MNRIMPTAVIDKSAVIGDETLVGHFALVREGVRIGSRCKIGSFTEICPNVIIKDDVWIHSRCFVVENTLIEESAFLGPGVILSNSKHPREPNSKRYLSPPTIRRRAKIGAGAVILPGIIIGEGAIVGAGAVVTRNVEPDEMVVGNPARALMRRPARKEGDRR